MTSRREPWEGLWVEHECGRRLRRALLHSSVVLGVLALTAFASPAVIVVSVIYAMPSHVRRPDSFEWLILGVVALAAGLYAARLAIRLVRRHRLP